MIIYLGCRSPGTSSNLPESIGRAILNASLFGLAPGGVCRAFHVTMKAVGSYSAISPLPALCKADCRRYIFCGTILEVTPSSCYEPPCPVEFGLSSAWLSGDHASTPESEDKMNFTNYLGGDAKLAIPPYYNCARVP